ncbi:MAG: ABC transporter transmembrane domain-containing protein, partial [Clostridia bacterium]
MSNETKRKPGGPMGGHGPGGPNMMAGEKAKDFKGTMKNLFSYLSKYKIGIFIVIAFAIGSTVFAIVGPKILGNATSEIFDGLVAKIMGTGGINFDAIGSILLFLLTLYIISSALSFVQGYIMSGVSQKIAYQMRDEISQKIHKMPMKYFESKTVGEVLSRVTNDVDTLSMNLNQSLTQIITSITTVI